MTAVNQKEYLKKYLGIGKSHGIKKKKKKSEKTLGKRLKIIDDDLEVSLSEEIKEDLAGDQEDAPQIVSVIDDRPPSLRIDERTKSKNWKPIGAAESDEEEQNATYSRESKLNLDMDIAGRSRKDFDIASTAKRHFSTPDISPPRPKREPSLSDISPDRRGINQDHSPERRTNRDCGDQSPQRRRNCDSGDQSPPRRRYNDSGDQSPKRRNNCGIDQSPPRRKRNDCGDQFPKRQKRDTDQSPPRRRNYGSADQSPRRQKYSNLTDQSARKKMKSDEDYSPKYKKSRVSGDHSTNSRKNEGDRGSHKEYIRSDNVRKDSGRHKTSRWNDNSPESSNVALGKVEKTLSGKRSGLQNAKDLVKELTDLKQRENELFSKLTATESGENAITVSRKKKTISPEEEAELKRKQKELEEKYSKWGKGLKQVEDSNEKWAEQLDIMSKPLARYADDEDLEKYLKEQEREGDPMLMYMRKKKKKKAIEAGITEKPVYLGEFLPNRFAIRPGHRWDGVDRSNGYEVKLLSAKNSEKAQRDEAFMWNTEDM